MYISEGWVKKVQKTAYVIYEWSLTSLNFEKSYEAADRHTCYFIMTLILFNVYFCKNCTNIERTNLN